MFTMKDRADRGSRPHVHSHGPDDDDSDTSRGVRAYSPLFLRYIYNVLVLGLYMSFVWCCPTRKSLLPFFSSHASPSSSSATPSTAPKEQRRNRRILDIGVGTGYFLQHAPLASVRDVVLVDLNPNCLSEACARTRAAHPAITVRTVAGDFLAPDGLQGLDALVTGSGTETESETQTATKTVADPSKKFDAISTMLLLHCLPGPATRKAAALVRLRHYLHPQTGVLFGTTILGKDVSHNLLGRLIMSYHNRQGIFDNRGDDLQAFIGPLEDAFERVEWRVEGRVLLFEASGVKGVE